MRRLRRQAGPRAPQLEEKPSRPSLTRKQLRLLDGAALFNLKAHGSSALKSPQTQVLNECGFPTAHVGVTRHWGWGRRPGTQPSNRLSQLESILSALSQRGIASNQ